MTTGATGELWAWVFWVIGPAASALGFAGYYLRHGRRRRISIPVALLAGVIAYGVNIALASDGRSPSPWLMAPGLLWWGIWVTVGAPLASRFVADRKGFRSPSLWALGTFLTTTLLLVLELGMRPKALSTPPPSQSD